MLLHPALADRLRDVERAVEDDVGDGVEGARRQALGRCDEVAGGVVDEAGQAGPVGPQFVDHLLHRLRDADVDAEGVDAPPREALAPAGGRLVADALAAPADGDVGAELEEALGHRLAEAGAAAGDQHALAFHQIGLVHDCAISRP